MEALVIAVRRLAMRLRGLWSAPRGGERIEWAKRPNFEVGRGVTIPADASEEYWAAVMCAWIAKVKREYGHARYPGVAVAAREPELRAEIIRGMALMHREYPVEWFAFPAIAARFLEGATAEEVLVARRAAHEAKAVEAAAKAARAEARAARKAEREIHARGVAERRAVRETRKAEAEAKKAAKAKAAAAVAA